MSFLTTLKPPVSEPVSSPEVEQVHIQVKEEAVQTDWGWLPAISVVTALALLLVAFAFNLGRNGAEGATGLFWLSLVVIIGPAAFRLVGRSASNRERLGLVVLVGLSFYAVKVLNSPDSFSFHDEFIHFRTANDILLTGHLFSPNPVIPVSPLYPGLQIITTAFGNLSGFSIFDAGILTLAVARLVLVGTLFLLYREVSRSPRIAGIACLVYMANPNFLYFSSQFAYESLSLPLAVLVLYAEARRSTEKSSRRVILNLTVVLGLVGLVISHHLTAFAMVGFLGLWALVHYWRVNSERVNAILRAIVRPVLKRVRPAHRWARDEKEIRLGWPGSTFMLIFVGSIAWLVYVATFTVGYLAPVLQGAIVEIVHLIEGEEGGRTLFQGSTGQTSPLWEQLTGYGAVLLIIMLLPFGIWAIRKRQRGHVLALTLAAGALAYPATLALRFTVAGWEISNRTSEFVFIPVGYVVAYGMVTVGPRLLPRILRLSIFPLILTFVFIGGVLVGTSPYSRLPGPYLVEGDSRSIQDESIQAAKWFLAELGPGNRTASDRDNNLLLISYGEQHGVMNVGDKVNVGPLFLEPTLSPLALDVLKRGQIRYVLVDKRLTTGLPMVGIYFESGEPDSNNHKTPISQEALAKFEQVPGIKKVFDSGNIVVYDVGAISGVS